MHSKMPTPPFFFPLALSLFLLCSAPTDGLADQLQASLQQEGQDLRLDVSVPAPPPSSIIAGIKLSPQVKIVRTSPASAKIDPNTPHIKWLVKNPRPGSHRFTVTSSPAVDFSQVSAEVLYRDPRGGSLQKIKAAKR